jgi:glycosidase
MPTSDTTKIRSQIQDKLNRIYGEEVGKSTFDQLEEILQPIRQSLPNTLDVTEEDVILICYGDHVQSADKSSLQALYEFLSSHVSPTINSVHLLPFYPWSSDDGFSVIDYYEVDPEIGTWDDIRAFTPNFKLMFDAVFNHISSKSEWFQKFLKQEAPFDEYFITVPPETDLSMVVRPRALPLLTPFETANGTKHLWTTFSEDQIDLNVSNPIVLIELLRALKFYVEQGARFIRLDAIAFLWKQLGTDCIHLEETHLIIQLMRDFLDVVASDVILITETNVPHEENISYFGDGTNEAQLVYQFPLPPLVLHTLASGDATHLTSWAQSLGSPGEKTTFFNFTASHDGVGLRPVTGILTDAEIQVLVDRTIAHGGHVSFKTNSDGSQSPYEMNITYFDAINNPELVATDPERAKARFIVAQAIQLSLAGVPGIYFSSLFGSRNWVEGVEQTGRNRTINRQKFDHQELENELHGDSLKAQVFMSYMSLLDQRRQSPAFHPLASQVVLNLGTQVFAVLREALNTSHKTFAIHNVSDDIVQITLEDLHSQHPALQALSVELVLQPYEVRWIDL